MMLRLQPKTPLRLNFYPFLLKTAVATRHSARMVTATTPSSQFSPSTSPRRFPLIVIIGSTGTGKSNLAVQLAHHLRSQHHGSGAEVVNADAMQLYHGLPIITNKINSAEQEGIPHHLLGHIGLEEKPWTILRFVKEADQAIEQIRERNNIPIVVGGTGYYVYGLLIRDAVLEDRERRDADEDGDCKNKVEDSDEEMDNYGKDAARTWPILDASTEEIYAKLQEVDPVIARRWHPKDRRKIQRSLEIFLRTGKQASQVYEQQQKGDGMLDKPATSADKELDDPNGTVTSEMSLRHDPIIFWLDAEDKALKARLDKRVDSMVTNGLLDEAREMSDFEEEMTRKGIPIDKSKGAWISIGYKEMEPWVQTQRNGDTDAKELSKLENACVEAVKAGTRRYAKRQNRYIRIRFANVLTRAHARDRLFLLDCSDLDKWVENVQSPAQTILDCFLQGKKLPEPSGLSELARRTFATMNSEAEVEESVQRKCETCDKILMTQKEWIGHIKSRSHRRVLEGLRRRELNESRKRAMSLAAETEPD